MEQVEHARASSGLDHDADLRNLSNTSLVGENFSSRQFSALPRKHHNFLDRSRSSGRVNDAFERVSSDCFLCLDYLTFGSH